MRRIHKCIWALGLLAGWLAAGGMEARAQEAPKAIPDSVFYLMPSFGEGLVYFRGQSPAQGQINICAVDNTLRFIDDDGKEMSVASHDNILRVRIDTVTFMRHQNTFVRLHPVSDGMGVAVRRDVRIYTDAKPSAYGGTSQTSSIKEIGTLYTEGGMHDLSSNKKYPYKMSETILIYNGDDVYVPTKKNLRKLFPAKAAEVDEYFKAHRSFPGTVEEARELISAWVQ